MIRLKQSEDNVWDFAEDGEVFEVLYVVAGIALLRNADGVGLGVPASLVPQPQE